MYYKVTYLTKHDCEKKTEIVKADDQCEAVNLIEEQWETAGDSNISWLEAELADPAEIPKPKTMKKWYEVSVSVDSATYSTEAFATACAEYSWINFGSGELSPPDDAEVKSLRGVSATAFLPTYAYSYNGYTEEEVQA